MGKFERKFGRYAIPNLTYIIVGVYVFGTLLSSFLPGIAQFLTFEPALIFKGQVWRLFSWLLIQSSALRSPYGIFSVAIWVMFYLSIGKTLERVWGDFTYNVYIFSGLLFTIVGVLLTYVCATYIFHAQVLFGPFVTSSYVYTSIFLAFAMTFPEAQVLLMFIIPIKVKWLGYIYAAMIGYEVIANLIAGQWFVALVILFSVLNFIWFYFTKKKKLGASPIQRAKQMKRRYEFNKDASQAARPSGIAKHKCAICGRTELTNPELEFRFCSKCNGNYEYCTNHLFTHKHVE